MDLFVVSNGHVKLPLMQTKYLFFFVEKLIGTEFICPWHNEKSLLKYFWIIDLCDVVLNAPKHEVLLIGIQTSNITFNILVVCHNLQICRNVIVNCSNMEISTFVARGQKSLIVDSLSNVVLIASPQAYQEKESSLI